MGNHQIEFALHEDSQYNTGYVRWQVLWLLISSGM
jgi:hypothetical protein